MKKKVSDFLFSDAVRRSQKALGSSDMIGRLESKKHWTAELSENQIGFISTTESFYLGTASKAGEPYIQHRGGPAGFLNVENKSTLWFPDFSGNRQYITVGNLSENNSAFIFIMDYFNRRRLKLWGNAYVQDIGEYPVDDTIKNTKGINIERFIKFNINAIDENCRRYIKQCYSETQYLQELINAKQEIADLKSKIKSFESKYK